MELAVEKMQEQLDLWSLKIDELTARTHKTGARTRFEDLMHIDELKASHALAQLKLLQVKAVSVEDAERTRLEAELKGAWNELDAALKAALP